MKKITVLCLFLFFSFFHLFAHDSETYKIDNPIIKFFKMGKSEMTTIAPVNALGREINDLYGFITWIGVGIFAIVTGIFLIVILFFREKKSTGAIQTLRHESDFKQKSTKGEGRGKFLLEVTWIVIPSIIIVLIAIPTVKLIFKIEDFPSLKGNKQLVYKFDKEPDQVYNKYLKVNVVGHQWWWEFEYLGMYELVNGIETFTPMPKITSGEARFPVNVPILFQVNSEDVIHSFWAPRLGGKIDANPGYNNHISFVFEQEGYFYGHCVEYCGASHALMRLNLVGVSFEEFQEWMSWGKGDVVASSASAQRGKELMTSCLACHTMAGMKDFVPRTKKYETALLDYFQQKKEYEKAIKNWKKTPEAELDGHFDIYKTKPKPPIKPRSYQEYLKTVAPDLTDISLRKRIISGIQENSRENLVRWIQNPPKIKPEIRRTVVPRMPVYENIYTEEQIGDIVEFLLTVEYSESPKKETLIIK
jgi:cytochrome c oxidase subunit 2